MAAAPFRALLLALAAFPASACRDAKGPRFCPSTNFFLPEGSSKAIVANISSHANMLALYKKNSSSSKWEEILMIYKGQTKHIDITSKDHFYISENALVIKNASKVLTGFYKLANDIDQSCVQQFSLKIPGPWHCSTANFSLAEDSSEIVIASISSNSHVLGLYKKDNFSSDWQYILTITNRQLNNITKEYKGHFLISEDGLAIKNATERLTGKYQLVRGRNESCMQQFFLDVSDPTICPSANFFSLEGSSKVIANISSYSNILVLRKENCSSSGWQDILFINDGRINYMASAYVGHLYISGHALAVKNASKVLTGCYQLAYYIDKSCVQQFSLGILSPWHHSSPSFSLVEGSSEMIIANMSTNSCVLALYKKDNLSCDWKHILSITNRFVSYVTKEYKGHFLISKGGLAVKNATEWLTGEYQLVGEGNESRVQQFFLKVAGSEATSNSTGSIIGISIAVLLVSLALLLGIYKYCKRKRRERNRNEPAYKFTRAPDSENGSVQHGICSLQGPEMDKLTQERQ